MSERRLHYGWVILGSATIIIFGALGLARFGYTVVLPAMQVGLGMQNTQAGVLATANLVGYLALSVVGGALASRFGPRAVITVGMTVVGLGMLLTATSTSLPSAALWRAMTGVGSGASNVPAMGLIAAWFASKRRGMATGIGVAGSSLALITVGPLAPGILAAYGEWGWRVCWVLFGGTALALAVVAFAFLRNHPSDLRLRPLGADPREPLPAPVKGTAGLHWGSVYRSGLVWHVGMVYVANGFSYIIYMTFFVKCLLADGGYTAPEAGKLFMTMGWFSLFCGLIWGSLSDVIGRKWALTIVYLIHTVAFSLFFLWPAKTGFTISVVLFGFTAWSIPAIMAATCGDVLGSRLAPAGLGFITLFFGIGQALGPSVAGAVADAAGSLLPSFLLAGGVAFLGAIGAVLLPHAALKNGNG